MLSSVSYDSFLRPMHDRNSVRVKLGKIKNGCVLRESNSRRVIHMNSDYIDKTLYTNINDGIIEKFFIYRGMKILHNDDGPAIIDQREDLHKFFYHGFRVLNVAQYCYLCEKGAMEEMLLVLKYGETL